MEKCYLSGMKAIALLLVVGATACAASQPAATTPAPKNTQPSGDVGATNLQGKDDPKRALSSDECQELGAWIAQVCHDNHTRQARIEGWCGDMVARAGTEAWSTECGKTFKYMDFMCFRTVDTPQSMMTCDRTVDH